MPPLPSWINAKEQVCRLRAALSSVWILALSRLSASRPGALRREGIRSGVGAAQASEHTPRWSDARSRQRWVGWCAACDVPLSFLVNHTQSDLQLFTTSTWLWTGGNELVTWFDALMSQRNRRID